MHVVVFDFGEAQVHESSCCGCAFHGHSEYTQDNATEFTIKAGGTQVRFHPDSSDADWDDAASVGKSWCDSVFARFDTWLQAAERPAELAKEWFTWDEEYGTWRIGADTIAHRAATGIRYQLGHAVLAPPTAPRQNGRWSVNLYARPTRDGFKALLQTIWLEIPENADITDPSVAVAAVTDALMPGQDKAW